MTPESLNRLVASAADDSSIIGICGGSNLLNEEGSVDYDPGLRILHIL
jgi:chitin synthase